MLKYKLGTWIISKARTKLVKNSFWGVLSNIIQNILFSIFFIVVARKYSTADFGGYIIANTLYSFILAFSSLGLGQWFVRELVLIENKAGLISKFFKIQLVIGVLFYIINVIISYALYDSPLIRHLSLLIGINIIFDNLIYVITFVNIACLEQRKSFVVLTVEAVLKFGVACFLFFSAIPIERLAFILILLRFSTLNLFIRIGSSQSVTLLQIIRAKVNLAEVNRIIMSNWPFIVIGSISVLYWRIGNILVSKILSMQDVANYEISFKLFAMAQILPYIVSTSLFPMLVKKISHQPEEAVLFFRKAFIAYTIYGLLAYTFVYSFADFFIPWLFGEKYGHTSFFSKEMFLTILVFPTALLQANLLVAMKKEKTDMKLNIASLVVNLIFCGAGLYYYKSLSIINYAIFISFFVFHLAQDIILVKKSVIPVYHAAGFYLFTISLVVTYHFLSVKFDTRYLFPAFWSVFALFSFIIYLKYFSKTKEVVIA